MASLLSPRTPATTEPLQVHFSINPKSSLTSAGALLLSGPALGNPLPSNSMAENSKRATITAVRPAVARALKPFKTIRTYLMV